MSLLLLLLLLFILMRLIVTGRIFHLLASIYIYIYILIFNEFFLL
jgi:hypothetical protein